VVDGGVPTRVGAAVGVGAVKILWSELRPSLARRKVKGDQRFDFDVVASTLNAAIDILAGGTPSGEGGFVAGAHRWLSDLPDIYQHEPVKRWLSEAGVRKSLINAIVNAFSGSDDLSAETEAAHLYESIAGVAKGLGAGVVDTTLQLLARSISHEMGFGDALLLNAMSDQARRLAAIEQINREVLQKVSGPEVSLHEVPADALDQFVRNYLERYKKLRAFVIGVPIDELFDLAVRADKGNLRSASPETKIDLFREAAAAHARGDKFDDARLWLKKLEGIASTLDLRADNARILICEGKTDEALRVLRDCGDTPISVSLTLDAIYRRDGSQAQREYLENKVISISRITGNALINIALHAEGDLEYALKILREATEDQIQQCPAVLSIRALVKFTLCKAAPQRSSIFDVDYLNPLEIRFDDTPDKLSLRASAYDDVVRFLDETARLKPFPHWDLIHELSVWLRLIHPDENVRTLGRGWLEQELKDIGSSPHMIKYALAYNVPFNVGAAEEYLENRSVLGGLDKRDCLAGFVLSLHSNSPDRLLQFIEKYRAVLADAVAEENIICFEVESLALVGNISGAREVLMKSAHNLSVDRCDALQSRILEIEGADSLSIRRAAFERTSNDDDRRKLVRVLLDRNRLSEALPHMIHFFSQAPSAPEAIRICDAYEKAGNRTGLSAFLKRNDVKSLSESQADLRSFYAWSAYYQGEMLEARRILTALRLERQDDNDRALFINLSLETGSWDDLHQVISDDVLNSSKRTARELISAARTGRVLGSSETEKLLEMGAQKAVEEKDPESLVAAYTTVVELGLEQKRDDAHEWFSKALEMSGPEGPIRTFDIKQLKKIGNEYRKGTDFVTSLLMKGDVPLAIAAQGYRSTLTDLIGRNMITNATQRTYWEKPAIPLFSGYRAPVELKGFSSVALDRSALLVLGYLGLLDDIFSLFDRIVVPRGTMQEFFEDFSQSRFHQPSRVEAGRALLNFVVTGLVSEIPVDTIASSDHRSKYSAEIARLLEVSKREEGVVIVSPPIYEVDNDGDPQEVEIEDISASVCDLQGLIDCLVDEGFLGSDDEKEARESFHDSGRRWSKRGEPRRASPILIEKLAWDRLNSAGLIPRLAKCFSKIFIDRSVTEEANELLKYEEIQSEVRRIIFSIRKSIAGGIQTGRVNVSPSIDSKGTGRRRRKKGEFSSLENFLGDVGGSEILVSDDRAVNRHNHVDDSRGRRIPIATTLDLIRTLSLNKADSNFIQRNYRKLRQAGVALVPFEASEINGAANRGNPDKQISYELSAIAQYLDFICSRRILNLPAEGYWYGATTKDFMAAIRDVWNDESRGEGYCIAVSENLLKVLSDPYDWLSPDQGEEGYKWAGSQKALRVSALSNAAQIREPARRQQYHRWVEGRIIAPLTLFEQSLLAEAQEYAKLLFASTFNDVLEKTEEASEAHG